MYAIAECMQGPMVSRRRLQSLANTSQPSRQQRLPLCQDIQQSKQDNHMPSQRRKSLLACLAQGGIEFFQVVPLLLPDWLNGKMCRTFRLVLGKLHQDKLLFTMTQLSHPTGMS
jgi:hypothetical protein